MENNAITAIKSLKVYLFRENSFEDEIRRFNVEFPISDTYKYLVGKVKEFFPELLNKQFTIYWEDEDNEKVAISSDAELYVALNSNKMILQKKLYVKIKSQATMGISFKMNEDGPVHYGVYCDECNKNITGIRYKCAKCHDYDLCSVCREADYHSHHPMYRIPHPDVYLDLFFAGEKHRSRRHLDAGKKKRKYEKRESGPETGDEMEDVHHGKYSHKKCKKAYKCGCKRTDMECGKTDEEDETNKFCRAGPYSQLVNEFLGYFNPIHFGPRQPPAEPANDAELPSRISYLRNLGSSLQKILDPLGVSVEFEVRPKEEPTKKAKNEKDEKQPSKSTSSAQPPQNEVRRPSSDPITETVNQKIEEITKILSNQRMSNAGDDNGWVSFEELKRGSEESQPSSSSEEGKTSAQASAPEGKKEVNGNSNLYPNLTPSNEAVRMALESMLAMGFTNEGNWLASLLEAKNGDINQVLETLSFQKKFTK